MIWVRGPWWDACWLLSGIPLALVLSAAALWIPVFWLFTGSLIIFQTGHSLSPVALAWMHRGFRVVVWERPWRFIWLPSAILVVAVIVGAISGSFWPAPSLNTVTMKIRLTSYWNPLWALAAIYGTWNIYHFGRQNFGVMSLYRLIAGNYGASQRRADLVFCCLMTWMALAVPFVHYGANYFRVAALRYYPVMSYYVALAVCGTLVMLYLEWRSGRWCLPRLVLILTNGTIMGTAMLFHPMVALGIVSYNHWLTAIGLSGHVVKKPILFPISIMMVGTVLGALLFCTHLMPDWWQLPVIIIATVAAIRLALGGIHFLYDGGVWKFRDARVRATIGREFSLFNPPSSPAGAPRAGEAVGLG